MTQPNESAQETKPEEIVEGPKKTELEQEFAALQAAIAEHEKRLQSLNLGIGVTVAALDGSPIDKLSFWQQKDGVYRLVYSAPGGSSALVSDILPSSYKTLLEVVRHLPVLQARLVEVSVYTLGELRAATQAVIMLPRMLLKTDAD